MELAESMDDKENISIALLQLIGMYSYKMQADKALDYLERLKKKGTEYLSGKEKRQLLLNEANINYQMNFDAKAQGLLYVLLHECKTEGDLELEKRIHYTLGHIYIHQQDYQKALEYFSRANEAYRKEGNDIDYPAAQFSKATTYTRLGEYEKAKELSRKAYAVALKERDHWLQIKSLDKLAEAFFYENNLEKTEEILDRILVINDTLKNESFALEFYYNKGFIHESRGQIPEALAIYHEVMERGVEMHLMAFRRPVYKRLKACYEKLGQYKEALFFTEKILEFNDSLYTEKGAQQLRFNQIQFETAEKEHENKVLSAQVSKQRNQNFVLVALVFAAIAFLIAFISVVKVRQVKKIDRIRMGIAQDLHDEVGSKLTHIQIYLNQLQQNLQEDETEAVKENSLKVNEIVRDTHFAISDLVWAINTTQSTMKNLINRLNDYADDLLRPSGIRYQFDVSSFKMEKELDPNLRQNILLFFKEAINNILKHTDSSVTKIKMFNANGNFNLEIINEFETVKKHSFSGGRGIQHMKQRAKKIDGKVIVNQQEQSFSVHLITKSFA